MHYIVDDFIYLTRVDLRGKANMQKQFQSFSQAHVYLRLTDGPRHACGQDLSPVVFHEVQLYEQFSLSPLCSSSHYEIGKLPLPVFHHISLCCC